MNLYHCFIDLKDDAKALSFAHSLDQWMSYLQAEGTIRSWRLLRRKLNLASNAHRDFLLEIEVDDLAQLDKAFRLVSSQNDAVEKLHRQITPMIRVSEFGLYRPFPDPERAERVALL
jgi:alkanesulfonate monooxygenase SsuD/methylene tetrahydromethanopterin reductase-like flavin-dependent oxidoreductase (luciferase family)